MMLKTIHIHRIFLSFSLILLAAASLFTNPIAAMAISSDTPTLSDFSESIQIGQKNTLRSVYVDNVLALPVVQQPAGQAGYVSNNDGEVTQFGLAAKYGNIGLLAHNHLAGKFFSQLAVGQEVRLVYDDGHVEYFVIKEVLKFQALQPESPYSSFKNLARDETLTAQKMFKRVYGGDRHVTFQTCIAMDGQLSWGRLFVIAVPKDSFIDQHSQ